jgi:dTDP-4-dehydrorhamnose reductase
MLGHKLWQRLGLSGRFADTWVTVRGNASDYLGIPFLQHERVIHGLDAVAPGELEGTLERLRPDVVINAVAVTKRHEDKSGGAADVLRVIRANTELPHRLAAWAEKQDSRVIHFSTDCVFDGHQGGYTESDPVNAQDLYGRSKALGEVGDCEGNCLTLRSSLIGREILHRTELLEWFLSCEGTGVKGFRQAVFSGLANWVMADLVALVIERHPGLRGVYQVAADPISKYDLLCLCREIFQMKVTIEPDDSIVCRRNLDGSRFREATGWIAPSWPEMVKGIANGY